MSTKKISSPGVAVMDEIHTLMHMYRHAQYQMIKDSGLDLTHMEMKVLGFFLRHPGAALSDLVAHSGKDKAQLARLIATLKDKHLLLAEPDQRDKRVMRLTVSDQGLQIHQHLTERGSVIAMQAVGGLSAEEQLQLLELLKRIKAGMQDQDSCN